MATLAHVIPDILVQLVELRFAKAKLPLILLFALDMVPVLLLILAFAQIHTLELIAPKNLLLPLVMVFLLRIPRSALVMVHVPVKTIANVKMDTAEAIAKLESAQMAILVPTVINFLASVYQVIIPMFALVMVHAQHPMFANANLVIFVLNVQILDVLMLQEIIPPFVVAMEHVQVQIIACAKPITVDCNATNLHVLDYQVLMPMFVMHMAHVLHPILVNAKMDTLDPFAANILALAYQVLHLLFVQAEEIARHQILAIAEMVSQEILVKRLWLPLVVV